MIILKRTVLALIVLAALSLTACGGGREDAPATEETQQQNTPVQTVPADSQDS